jgi:hypothetical protein
MTDFSAPKVKRGRLTNYRTANFVEFTLNPTQIRDSKGNNMVEQGIPGFSDPFVMWASGKARVISFDLDLCGETRLRTIGNQLTNGASNSNNPETAFGLTINGELEYYMSMEYPVDPTLPGSDGGPDKFVFTYGGLYRAVLCFVSVNVVSTEYDPNLDATRGTVSVTLTRLTDKTIYAHEVWSPPVEGLRV